MQRTDYILRLIERLGAVLIGIRKKILGQQASEVEILQELRSAAAMAGFDLTIARAATPETLHLMLSTSGDIDPARAWSMAEVLYLDGLEAKQRGHDEQARRSLGNALTLFALVQPGGAFLNGWPEASERAAEIERLLGEL